MLWPQGLALAAAATAATSATIVSPAAVTADALTQLLFSPSVGQLAISIPGGSPAGDPGSHTGSGGPAGSGSPEAVQVAALTLSGDGTLAGGQGVSLSLGKDGSGNRTAIVAYN